jgi:hypothetical protein
LAKQYGGDHPLSAGRFLLLISVSGRVSPRAVVRLGGLGKLRKYNDLIRIRTRDLVLWQKGIKTGYCNLLCLLQLHSQTWLYIVTAEHSFQVQEIGRWTCDMWSPINWNCKRQLWVFWGISSNTEMDRHAIMCLFLTVEVEFQLTWSHSFQCWPLLSSSNTLRGVPLPTNTCKTNDSGQQSQNHV